VEGITVPRFSNEFLDDLMSRIDFVSIVSDYVRDLSNRGGRYKGLCPFHSEKTPSFTIEPNNGLFYCFGCHKGGSAVQFIMEIENLPFEDAVRLLARRAGISVPESSENKFGAERRARLLEIIRESAKYFHATLHQPEGNAALRYMKDRGISEGTATRFGIGAAPDNWTSLCDHLRKNGYSEIDIIDSGMGKRGKTSGIYDTFRDRLMFPVIDTSGSVIGFSGRALKSSDPAKYLNSPDTPVFTKGKNLFALNFAKKSKHGMLLLVEGNIDVVTLHQAGFDCAVASLGTALTEQQARLMKKFTDNIVLCYDSDEAGVKATERAVKLLEPAGLNVRIIHTDGAKDPDEYIRKNGAEAFTLLLDRSETNINYRLRQLLSENPLSTSDGKSQYIKKSVQEISTLSSPAEREIYGRQVAGETGIAYETIQKEVENVIKSRQKSRKTKESRDELQVARARQPSSRSLRYTNTASAIAEQGIILCLTHDPETLKILRQRGFTADSFTHEFLKNVFENACEMIEQNGSVNQVTMTAPLSIDESSELTRILSEPFDVATAGAAMNDYIDRIYTLRNSKLSDPIAALDAVLNNNKKGNV